MRSIDEIQYALSNVEREIAGINDIACPSEQAAAVGHRPKWQAEAGMLRWVLEGERPTLIVEHLFVGQQHAAIFREFAEHWDDDIKEALDEADEDDYQQWLDTREPGEEYPGRSENNPGPQYESRLWLSGEEQGETGIWFEVRFYNSKDLFDFAYWWGRKVQRLAQKGE